MTTHRIISLCNFSLKIKRGNDHNKLRLVRHCLIYQENVYTNTTCVSIIFFVSYIKYSFTYVKYISHTYMVAEWRKQSVYNNNNMFGGSINFDKRILRRHPVVWIDKLICGRKRHYYNDGNTHWSGTFIIVPETINVKNKLKKKLYLF